MRLRIPATMMLTAMGVAIVAAGCGPLQLPAESKGKAGVPAPSPKEAAPPPPKVAPPGAAVPGPVQLHRAALLLPLSGPQHALAEAIRDGFLAAYLDDHSSARKPDLIILDEERRGAAEAYRTAVAAGADIVVGPLLKESVAEVAAVAGSVPTLALNYMDAAGPTPGSFYQFSLAPEDEAREVAARAYSDGWRRAIALLPDNEWGRRLLKAFTSALEERGGEVLAYRFYDTGATDFTAPIQSLLLLDESRERYRRLSAYLGIPLEFEPRRRSDVDFIFLAANVALGRLIRPQLRYLYAGDIPTYSTSAVHRAGAAGDADLDGIMFADAPAVLGVDPRARALREELARRWPAGAVSLLRFYAMGFDAYGLMTAVPSGAIGLEGLSGMLSMDDSGHIHRRLPWAAYRDGQIVLLPEAASPGPAAALAPR